MGFKVPLYSTELFAMLPSAMGFRGTLNFPQKIMEFHGTWSIRYLKNIFLNIALGIFV